MSTGDFGDTDSSSEDEEVLISTVQKNITSSSTSSTSAKTYPLAEPVLNVQGNSDTEYTTSMKNYNENLDAVPNKRGDSGSNFTDVKKHIEGGDIDYVTYAVKDVEIIDNVRFDDTDNSVLEDDFPLDEFED